MATIIDALAVTITARTEPFRRQMKKTEKAMGGLRKSFKGMNAAVAGLGAALATGAVAAGFLRIAGSIDALAKTSDKLGISIEQLQQFRIAAELNGVAIGTMEMALQRMTRRVAEAAAGTGEARNAIAELGLDAQRLNQAGPAEAFKIISEAIKNTESQADRIRLAMKFFDSEGVALVNVMRMGRDGLDAMADEAERLGLNLNRVDAAQVEAANDAIARVKLLISGALQQAVVQLAPFVEEVANRLTQAGTSGEGMGAKVVDALEMVVKAASIAGSAVQVVASIYVRLQQAVTLAIEVIVRGMSVLVKTVNTARTALGMDPLGLSASLDQYADSLADEVQVLGNRAGGLWADAFSGGASREFDRIRAGANRRAADAAAAALGLSSQTGSAAGAAGASQTPKVAPEVKKLADATSTVATELQTRFVRFASSVARGGRNTPAGQTAQNTKKTAKAAEQSSDYLERLLEEARRTMTPAVVAV